MSDSHAFEDLQHQIMVSFDITKLTLDLIHGRGNNLPNHLKQQLKNLQHNLIFFNILPVFEPIMSN